MAIKHLITWGIGSASSGDYPLFLVTHGLSVPVAVVVPSVPGIAGERLAETFGMQREQTTAMHVLRQESGTLAVQRRYTKDFVR